MVKRYLELVSLETALETIRNSFEFTPGEEEVPVTGAAGRITSRPVFARFSIPQFHLSAMDGIAVVSADTVGASEQRPMTLGRAVRVNTGNVIPAGFDAVVMIEDVLIDGDRYTIRAAAPPWQHIRSVGEDIGETEMIVPSGHRITPRDIGALVSYGVVCVPVRSLSMSLIPTGSELVPVGQMPPPGKVIESNMVMAAAYLEGLGANCTKSAIVPDEPDAIRESIAAAVATSEIIVVSAGSSKGTKDYTADIIGELGEVLIHGVAIKPARPVIIGKISGKPVIGMPGYPLAALTILREMLRPMFEWYGMQPPEAAAIPARLTSTLASDIGTREFVLLSVGRIGGQWVAIPQSRGAGIQMSAVRANAYLSIPPESEGFEAGMAVEARLMVPRSAAETSLLITGSHDPAIDYLADLAGRAGTSVHATHVGSMGGLIALKKGECHAAPMHLLAPDGSYNTGYLSRYMPGEELVLLGVAGRQQGVVSAEGMDLSDLPGHWFANRQRGSGTRMLLDHLLEKERIDPADIPGFDREYTTHLAVALAVKTGEAEAGICVYSAAHALDLPFVPIGTERYELVMKREVLEADDRVGELCRIVSSEEFKTVLERLGGYDTDITGVLRALP